MKKYMSSNSMTAKHKDVLFLPSGAIGDALMMLALCAEIEKLNPHVRCKIIARRNAALIQELTRAYPSITVVAIPKGIGGFFAFVWHSIKKPYIVLMPGPFGLSPLFNTDNFLRLLNLRIGTHTYGLINIKGETTSNPYGTAVAYDHTLIHYDNLRRLAHAAGLAVQGTGEPIIYTIPEIAFEPPFTGRQYIVFHPFGSNSWKSFPPRRSREIIGLLRKKYPNLSVAVTCIPEDKTDAQGIIEGMAECRVLAELPILQVAALIRHAALYIGVDTGITHLASILNAKSVVLSHNKLPSWKQRYNHNAIILTNDERCVCDGGNEADCAAYEDGKPYMRCLYDITNDAILDAAGVLLRAQNP